MRNSKCDGKRWHIGRRLKFWRLTLWGDWLILVVIAVIAALLFFSAGQPADSGGAALIANNEVIQRWSSQDLSGSGTYYLELAPYHYEIEYSGGRIRIAAADCPDQICVKTGWISREGQMAVCLPGRVVLKIVGTKSDPVDIVVK